MLSFLRRLFRSSRPKPVNGASRAPKPVRPSELADAAEASSARRRLARGTAQAPMESSGELRILAFRTRYDMNLAREFQRRFLPVLPDNLEGVRIATEYCPAFDVGGDFYDLVRTGPDRFSAVIGDVSGKGVAAALVMSRVTAEFRRAAHRCLPPHEILADVNQFLIAHGLENCFVTATCVEVDLASRRMSVANAGHVPPVVRDARGAVRMCGEASGAPLGLVEGETYRCETFPFEPNDIVLLVTDGVTEALEPDADPALRVLTGMVADSDHDVYTLKQHILGAVNESKRPRRADDVALLAMQLA